MSHCKHRFIFFYAKYKYFSFDFGVKCDCFCGIHSNVFAGLMLMHVLQIMLKTVKG